jgi:cytoplasmic iron level regulating protein YaaA (DUF328/UPF0246 family)
MLFLLSPAKALDYDTPAGDVPHTQPLFVKQSAELIDILQEKTPHDIASLMHLSDALSSKQCWLSTAMSMKAWTPKP